MYIRLENTPQYGPYEDETQNDQTFFQLAEELQPSPEVGDHYIGAEVLLPRGDKVTRGHVVAQSHDANGNIMGKAHVNPILDNRMYKVKLIGGRVTELIAKIISESIYAQCDADRNEYLLLDSVVNYFNDKMKISLTE